MVGWSVGSRSRGADYWRPIVETRRRIYDALKAWEPEPALGPPPAEVNEPFTVMLWGITTSTVAGRVPAAAPTPAAPCRSRGAGR